MKRLLYGQTLLVICFLTASSLALAEPGPNGDQQANNSLSGIPVVGFVTQRFMFSGHYQFKLTRQEMRIDHIADQNGLPMPKRTCHIGLGYATPIMGQTGSGLFELPIIGSEQVTSQWTAASFGDYIAHFSQTPTYDPGPRIFITLKF